MLLSLHTVKFKHVLFCSTDSKEELSVYTEFCAGLGLKSSLTLPTTLGLG